MTSPLCTAMLTIRYQINEINETVPKQEIRTCKPHPDRARTANEGMPISSGIMRPLQGRAEEGSGHRGGAKRRAALHDDRGWSAALKQAGCETKVGVGSLPGLRHQALLYMAPKVSASAIAAYTHDV